MQLERPQWVQEHWGGFIFFKPIWVKTLNFVIRNSLLKKNIIFLWKLNSTLCKSTNTKLYPQLHNVFERWEMEWNWEGEIQFCLRYKGFVFMLGTYYYYLVKTTHRRKATHNGTNEWMNEWIQRRENTPSMLQLNEGHCF